VHLPVTYQDGVVELDKRRHDPQQSHDDGKEWSVVEGGWRGGARHADAVLETRGKEFDH